MRNADTALQFLVSDLIELAPLPMTPIIRRFSTWTIAAPLLFHVLAELGELIDESSGVDQIGTAVSDSLGSAFRFGVVLQVLILDVISTADHEHDRLLKS